MDVDGVGVSSGGLPGSGNEVTLPTTLAECHAIIQMPSIALAQLQQQVALLSERVQLNSNNSSKPPSLDGPGEGNRAARRASERKRGAQPDHKGHTRAMLDEDEDDRVVNCRPQAVCDYGAPARSTTQAPQWHQIFDVPPLRAQVDEYRLYSGRCAGCGKAHAGVLPSGVPRGQLPASSSYGGHLARSMEPAELDNASPTRIVPVGRQAATNKAISSKTSPPPSSAGASRW